MVFVNGDFRGHDFRNIGMRDNTFVQCDFRGAKFPEDNVAYARAKFIDCTFNVMRLTGSRPEQDFPEEFLVPFYEAGVRVLDGHFAKTCFSWTEDSECVVGLLTYKDFDHLWPDPECDAFVYKIVSLEKTYGFNTKLGLAILTVPKDARTNIFWKSECRVDKAKVERIEDFYGNEYPVGYSAYVPSRQSITYRPGETVYSDGWNENPMAVCTQGIHFFMEKREAWEYAKM